METSALAAGNRPPHIVVRAMQSNGDAQNPFSPNTFQEAEA
jgi:hypothetical protein